MRLLTRVQLSGCIEWLLANGSPPIRYLTLRQLVKAPDTSKDMIAAHRMLLECREVQQILAKQRDDGSWCDGGAWAAKPHYVPRNGYSAFTPKYVTAVWILSLLGDMGLSVAQQPIRHAAEYVMSFLKPNGLFSRFIDDRVHLLTHADNTPCDLGLYLTALGKVGLGGDRRLTKSYRLLAQWQREDGGWITQKHKVERNWWRSCPAATGAVIAAFYFSGRPYLRQHLIRGLQFQVWHLEGKREDEPYRFYYHGHNMIRELLMLAELRVRLQRKPARQLLRWLGSMYHQDQHCFLPPKTSSGRTRRNTLQTTASRYYCYHLVERDWLTFYAARIAAAFLPSQA